MCFLDQLAMRGKHVISRLRGSGRCRQGQLKDPIKMKGDPLEESHIPTQGSTQVPWSAVIIKHVRC